MEILAVVTALSPQATLPFAGRPLVRHMLDAARAAKSVTQVALIARSGDGAWRADKLEELGVERIDADAAHPDEDRAHTIAVALEALRGGRRLAPSVAVLLDPFFPWFTSELISRAIEHLMRCGGDSLLSVVPLEGGLWLQDGDGVARASAPGAGRRFVEIPGLCAVRVGIFEQARALPCGRTVLFETPSLCGMRASPEDDWRGMENLFRRQTSLSARARLKGVRLLVLDFDGVMTDNRVLVMQDGSEGVLCNRSDGLGLERLRALPLPVVVISKERNPVVAARCRKLSIPCHQGIDDKIETLRNVAAEHGITLEACAYMGNDVNDVECMQAVGVALAPADAWPEALRVAHVVTAAHGGAGAVREVCDLLRTATGDDD